FTPDKMHLLALSPGIHYRESLMLSLKSAALLPAAETGFFYVSNSTHKGFQQGDPQSWPLGYYPKSRAAVNLQLFSDQGSLDINLGQKGFSDPLGVSQADVNRIIQTVHKAPEKIARASSSSQ
ncbi:MAG TPA: hypothetical protein VGU90_14275, partial [Terriglobales bacterium]|nr:hypothetical protein [Terriglobales bacterium]